jgi:hypothetical protein
VSIADGQNGHGQHFPIHKAAIGEEHHEYQQGTYGIKPNLTYIGHELFKAVVGVDHEVTGDEHKDADPGFAQKLQQLDKGFVAGIKHLILVKAIGGVVIGHYGQHTQNTQELQLTVSLLGVGF